jgi:hypothetical protein
MGRVLRCCYALLMLLLAPRLASAIQLHWNDGSAALTFTEAIRCTLVVQADSIEQHLPSEWRLLWVADSTTDINPVPLTEESACAEVVAQISAVDEPATSADSAAHLRTAHFCSDENEPLATVARYVIDLPAGGAGKFKVVALDPSDSTQVIESNEATFNGGVTGDYAPAILRVTTVHQSMAFHLSAFGAGLGSTRDLVLAASDGAWRTPLTVTSRTDGAVTATAPFAATVPACIVEILGAQDAVASAPVPSDAPPPLLYISDPPEGCDTRMREVWSNHDPYLIQPKDFALVPGGWSPAGTWTFHIFYIRKNQYLLDVNTEKNIGHAVSDSLSGWSIIDTAAIAVRPGRFDSQHVWAPSIVLKGLTYHMFYTGVDAYGDQRIGRAISTDLVHWVQGDSILEVNSVQIPWADPNPTPSGAPYHGQTQLRDPFVMEDPNSPGDWLMYFTTVAQAYSPDMVIGVARSNGDFAAWSSTFPLWNTYHPWRIDRSYVVESPHAFLRDGAWWLFSTVNNDSVWAESNTYAPIDTVSTGARWSSTQKLWTLVPPLQAANLYFWHATEYLQISTMNDIEYLAAYNDAYVCVSITQMRPTSSPYLFSMGCPSLLDAGLAGEAVEAPGLLLTGLRPARSQVGLRLKLPARMPVRLAVYDVMGRHVRTVVAGEVPAGMSDWTWDGRDDAGSTVGSGVYFISLHAAGRQCSVRVPLVR